MDNLTKNNFFDGTLTVYQNKNGYRFSLDPILLAAHIALKGSEKIVDMGTGSGIIPLSIFHRNKNMNFKIFGIEIQKSLSDIAKKNVIENNACDKIKIINKDINQISQKDIEGPCDIVVSNPPYQNQGAGRINPLSEKALARHEIKLNLKMLLEKTKSILKNKGHFFVIYPARRTSELIHEMEKIKITPKRIRFIHSFENTSAVMVICHGISNGNSGTEILNPLYIYKDSDRYSEETLKILT
ncbi:MAG: methyltransferase [Desulfobacteraceae bacterium]|nr:methyltransferase [Desulfobacteraceae bacterium]